MKITLWSKWYLITSKDTLSIRRYRKVGTKTVWERLAKEKYKDLSKGDAEAFVKKLNVRIENEERLAKARFDYDNSFITPALLSSFETHLKKGATSQSYVTALLSALRDYSLKYFILERKLPDPKAWAKVEAEWGLWLRKKNISLSTIRNAVQATNRLIKFAHKQSPELIPFVELEPLGAGVVKSMKASKVRLGKYIPGEDWKEIEEKISIEIKSVVQLGYYYGTRRAESVAIGTECLFEDFLAIKKQVKTVTPTVQFSLLKNKEARECPNWFISAEEAYQIISDIKILHPSTLSLKFNEEMKRLNFPYRLHDLRRTFITNALRSQNPRDVQMAVGHTDLRTTMLYAQDDRRLQRKPFIPKMKSVK